MITRFCFIAILCLFSLSSCSRSGGPDAALLAKVDVLSEVEYGRVGERALHLSIARPKVPPAAPMPVVIWIHGGGWLAGTHKDNAALFLALYGFFTVSVEYRLSGEAIWPAQLDDCREAIRWVRAHAAEYHIDPERIGVWGASAGGHLAACLQVESGDGKHKATSVQAVVDWSGPADLTDPACMNPFMDAICAKLCGGPKSEKETVWKDASPVLHIAGAGPPIFIVHGDADDTVPIRNSQKLKAALEKAGAKVEMLTVVRGNHGYTAPSGQPAAEPAIQAILLKVADFFNRELKK